LLNAIALLEGMKMMGAIAACILAAGLVIYYNNREQLRLEKALDATAVLAAAVQRFVPKNQLKTMGVRSIVQCTAGMATEVALNITFSDIRNFTRMSESMTRMELFNWLSRYSERMSTVIKSHQGFIATFLGDGLCIIHPQPSNAMNSAIQMQVAVDALNLDIVAAGGRLPITIGVGSHYSVVVAGTFGDENRITASFIGTGVNLASRLESMTKTYGNKILATQEVIERISSDVFSYRCVGKVQIAGAVEPMLIYDVINSDALEVKEYKLETREDFETAIKLAETDPEAAQTIFNRIALIAHERNIKDKALQNRLAQGAENDIGSSTASSAQQHYLQASTTNATTPQKNYQTSQSRVDSFLNSQNNNSNNNAKKYTSSSPVHAVVTPYNPRAVGGESPHQSGVIEFEKNGDIKTPPRSPQQQHMIMVQNLPHVIDTTAAASMDASNNNSGGNQNYNNNNNNYFVLDSGMSTKQNNNKAVVVEAGSEKSFPPPGIMGTMDGKNYGASVKNYRNAV
jgi:class 3 adenylate cyclase